MRWVVAQITYGSTDGQYFTQWRFDLLAEFLDDVEKGPANRQQLPIEDAKIWYDKMEDFHRLEFKCRGRVVSVKFYEAFSCEIDGREFRTGSPQGLSLKRALVIRNELGVTSSVAES